MPNNQPDILSSLVNCTCAMTHWKLLYVSIPCFLFLPCSSKRLYFVFWKCLIIFWEPPLHTDHQNRKKWSQFLEYVPVQNQKKKTCLFSLYLLRHGWKFWRKEGPGTNLSEPWGGWKLGCSVAGEDETHSLTTLSSGSNHSEPGKTYPDVLLAGSPTPQHRHTFMGHTWAGLKVPISPRVHIHSATVYLLMPSFRTEPLAI